MGRPKAKALGYQPHANPKCAGRRFFSSLYKPIELQAMATRVRSYSKINLGLAIGPVRADGFHGLATLYQTLALHDVVTVEARGTGNSHPSEQRPLAGDPDREQGTGNRVRASGLEGEEFVVRCTFFVVRWDGLYPRG